MAGFTKLYGDKLLKSSLWEESEDVRLLFFFFLAAADADGFIEVSSVKGLARMANMDVDRVRPALAVLEAPDPDSRSKAEDGRRVVFVDEDHRRGWLLVNHAHYREHQSERQAKRAEAMRRHRAKRKATRDHVVTTETTRDRSESTRDTKPTTRDQRGQPCPPEAEAEAEAEETRGEQAPLALVTPEPDDFAGLLAEHAAARKRAQAHHGKRETALPGKSSKSGKALRDRLRVALARHGPGVCRELLAFHEKRWREDVGSLGYSTDSVWSRNSLGWAIPAMRGEDRPRARGRALPPGNRAVTPPAERKLTPEEALAALSD